MRSEYKSWVSYYCDLLVCSIVKHKIEKESGEGVNCSTFADLQVPANHLVAVGDPHVSERKQKGH